MAIQPLHAVSLVSGNVSDPSNAFGAIDGVFTTDTGNTNWTARWAIDNIAEPHMLVGTQEFSIRLRSNQEGGNAPSVTSVQLYQNGVAIGGNRFSGEVTASGAGVDILFVVATGELTGTAGVDIEVATSGAGGATNLRRSIQIDSFTWNADHYLIFGTPMKVYQGGQWLQGYLKYYDGIAWVEKPAKVYQDGTWVVQ